MDSIRRAVLFADVCDSTGLYETLGDAQASALINRLLRLLGKSAARHAGSVVKSLGDGMVCQFSEVEAAFRTAAEMQAETAELSRAVGRRIAIKAAFTYGPVVVKGGDVFGDTVNICSRLAEIANPDQVLSTQQTVEALSEGLRQRCRELYPLRLRGRADPIVVHEVLWRIDPDMTETHIRPPAAGADKWRLKLTCEGETLVVEPGGEARIGRDRANHLVIGSLRASRMHARVFERDGHFIIADQSTNGTYLLADGSSREVLLRREEAVLGERGWIGLGDSASTHGPHVLRYRLERRAVD